MTSAAALIAASMTIASPAGAADDAVIQRRIDTEFQPSTLSKDDQKKELEWFAKAAEPFKGMDINIVSETITTHEYESRTLAKAFTEITGIKVKHDTIQEGDVVEKLQTQMQSGKNVYDGWINDSDLIGTHSRYNQTVILSDYMTGAGKEFTNPDLDIKDFIGTKFTTAPDGKLYQLPDQQFANLYWFRADWFASSLPVFRSASIFGVVRWVKLMLIEPSGFAVVELQKEKFWSGSRQQRSIPAMSKTLWAECTRRACHGRQAGIFPER